MVAEPLVKPMNCLIAHIPSRKRTYSVRFDAMVPGPRRSIGDTG